MNRPVSLDDGSLRLLYKKYKVYFVPSGIILSCIVLFFVVVFPQFQEISVLQDQNNQQVKRIQQMQSNIQLLSSINDADYAIKLTTATSALPSDKDFIGILSAVGSAAQESNVSVGDYTFSVGNLATESAKLSSQLSLQMQLDIDGGPQGAKNFTHAVLQKLPLAEVTNVSVNGAQTSVTISFFYEPAPNAQFDPGVPIHTVSAADNQQLDTLHSWLTAENTPASSITGTPSPSPSNFSSPAVISPVQPVISSPTVH